MHYDYYRVRNVFGMDNLKNAILEKLHADPCKSKPLNAMSKHSWVFALRTLNPKP